MNGRGLLVYNVHGLSHIAADVKTFGPLDSFSSFPFENFLGQLKRLVRKLRLQVQQVIRRSSERLRLDLSALKKRETVVVNDEPKKVHSDEPVP